MKRVSTLGLVLLVIASVFAIASPARAEVGATSDPLGAGMAASSDADGGSDAHDPFFLNWPVFLGATHSDDHAETTGDDCQKGQVKCVDKVIKQMTKRFNRLECDHDSTFAFTYLLTTEEYRRSIEDPDFFTDNAFVNHQDAVFAEYYFAQFDAWDRGAIEHVSPAWRIAFHAAEHEEVTGMGNVFLGMNAHVNRDLPFVLAEIGLVKPDGTSRKADHDKVNEFLAAVNQYLLAEAAQVLDPTLDDGDVPGVSADNSVAVQALVAWREQAWRNAERLVAAQTPDEWAAVAADIEEQAAYEALSIRESFRYSVAHDLAGQGPSDRNQFCATHFERR